MTGLRITAAFLLLAACSGGGDGGGGGADGSPSGSATLSLSGSACQSSISFTSDAPISIRMNGAGLDLILVADGPLFDVESESAWTSYAASHDVFLALAFSDIEAATPHTITSIFDSIFAGKGTGTVGFTERDPAASIEITEIDMEAMTLSLTLSIPVGAYSDMYPPDFANVDSCGQGVITGSISGSFSLL